MSCVQCCPKRLSSLLLSAQIYKLDAECDWANWYGKSNLFCQGGVCKYLNGAMFDHTKQNVSMMQETQRTTVLGCNEV